MLAHFLRQGLVNPRDSSLPCFATQAIFSIAISPIVFYLQKVPFSFSQFVSRRPLYHLGDPWFIPRVARLEFTNESAVLVPPLNMKSYARKFQALAEMIFWTCSPSPVKSLVTGPCSLCYGPTIVFMCMTLHDHICWLNVACSCWCQCSSWWWWWRWWWCWWRCSGYTW